MVQETQEIDTDGRCGKFYLSLHPSKLVCVAVLREESFVWCRIFPRDYDTGSVHVSEVLCEPTGIMS